MKSLQISKYETIYQELEAAKLRADIATARAEKAEERIKQLEVERDILRKALKSFAGVATNIHNTYFTVGGCRSGYWGGPQSDHREERFIEVVARPDGPNRTGHQIGELSPGHFLRAKAALAAGPTTQPEPSNGDRDPGGKSE